MAQTKTKTAKTVDPKQPMFSIVVVWQNCDEDETEAEVRVADKTLAEAMAIADGCNLLADTNYVAFPVPQPLPRKFFSYAVGTENVAE